MNSVTGEDVTLCPCLPGSPDSPLIPLWPYRQEQTVKYIHKMPLGLLRKQKKTYISISSTYFHAGEAGVPVQTRGAGVGTLKNTTA